MIALNVAKLFFFFAGKRNFSLNKAKEEKKNVESLDQFRRLEVREKSRNVFMMSLRLSYTSHLHQVFSISLGFSPFFARISYFQTFGV